MKKPSEDRVAPAVEPTAGPADSAHGRTAQPKASPPAPSVHDEGQGTRNRVARSILDHGPSTAAELALRLELTQAAVRRHLDALVAEGVVEPREKRIYGARGRGRPAKSFALTDCGRDAFDQAYDQLATDALRWIAQSAGGGAMGEAAVAAFARARFAAQAQGYRAAVEAAGPEGRTEALAEALTADGYAATARSAPNPQLGEQLCQHHCPVAHVAEQYPQLCEAETEVFSRLLGTHVQRLATIAHGDGVCTTFVPKAGAGKAAHPTGGRTTQTTTASARTAGRNPA
ncbi:helix-turn-helix transcriptional regulator [Streptomyces gilvosporeus]|uniref:Transcriptional regulator n=1 Tax=Streptomyces gilvosporeus TaxID=553510 RepID=A0A1V0TPP4_9ACTN|nr:transcriptional regulator [Streptomyces gilvosporeus]